MMIYKKLIFTGIITVIAILMNALSVYAALDYTEIYTSSTGTQNILLIINDSIYEPMRASLTRFIADLESEGYRITLTKFRSGSAEEFKNYLRVFPGLKGAILIGRLPTAWFEIADDFGQYGYQSFPIDLFYMDLDGQWIDDDMNGIYDDHTGNRYPEIWVARIYSGSISNPEMDEVGLLRNYFYKDHLYRMGGMSVAHRALAYVDDDWVSYFSNCNLDLAYSNVTTINDSSTTIADDYKRRLKDSYEWVHICAHSSYNYMIFKVGGGWSGGTVESWQIRDIDPATIFYNLFNCSATRYTDSESLGCHYVFAKTNGLTAVGSAKIGSMLDFQYFYSPMGFNFRNSIGESLKAWFAREDLVVDREWFYGMNILGDPTLTIDPPVASIESITISGQSVTFRGTGMIHSGNINAYSWRSDKDGFLSSSNTFTSSSLSQGEHIIYFKVKDNLNRWSSEAAKTVMVNVRYGDVDGNGEVAAYDAALTAQASVEIITLTPEQIIKADVDGNGEVAAYDAALIAQYSVGIIDHFPVEG